MKRRSTPFYTMFMDVLFNLLLLFALLINPITKDADSKPIADYTLMVTWPYGMDTDIDTNILLPDNNVVWFKRKDAVYINLTRDDLGTQAGKGNTNIELVEMRDLDDGVYYTSITTYSSRVGVDNASVGVELLDRQGSVVGSFSVPMPKRQGEVGVLKFTVKNKRVVEIVASDKLLIGTYIQ